MKVWTNFVAVSTAPPSVLSERSKSRPKSSFTPTAQGAWTISAPIPNIAASVPSERSKNFSIPKFVADCSGGTSMTTPIMYRFLSEERTREILAEHDSNTRVEELLKERYGSLTEALMEQVRRRPRR